MLACSGAVGASDSGREDRLISFETREGTWLSLDVSPDGKTIVFDMLGDLYLLPIEGGTARRITSGPEFDAQPRFSPDGRRIAFTSDRDGYQNLWTANADGSDPRQLTRSDKSRFVSPEWEPDGRAIVASTGSVGGAYANRFPPFGLWRFPIDGGAPGELTAGLGLTSYLTRGASFDAAGGLHLTIHEGARVGPEVFFPWAQVYAIDARRHGKTAVTRRVEGGFSASFSPDGRWMVYGSRDRGKTTLLLRDLGTGQEEVFARGLDRDQQEAASDRDILPNGAFTPDSRAFVIAYGGKIWRIDTATGARRPIPFVAKVEQRLAPLVRFANRVDDDPIFFAQQISTPVLSPDGSKLAFRALAHVWMMEVPNGVPRKLSGFAASGLDPTWTPDGRGIVFATWSETGGGDLYRVDLAKPTAPVRLTPRSGFYSSPAISPDRRRIAVRFQPTADRLADLRGGVPATGSRLHSLPAQGGALVPVPGMTSPVQFAGASRVFFRDASGREDSGMQGSGSMQAVLASSAPDGSDRHIRLRAWEHASYEDWSATYRDPSATLRGYAEAPAERVIADPTGRRALIHTEGLKVFVADLTGADRPDEVTTLASGEGRHARRLTDLPADWVAWAADGKTILHAFGRTIRLFSLDGLERSRFDVRLPLQRRHGSDALLLRGARVITMRGDEVLERGDILVRGRRIERIGAEGSFPVPRGARVLGLRGRTIVPGFVDNHDHSQKRLFASTAPQWQYLEGLSRGITTSFDPSYLFASEDSDLIEAGIYPGPRLRGALFYGQEIDPADAVDFDAYAGAQRQSLPDRVTAKDFIFHRRQRQWLAAALRRHRVTPTAEGPGDMYLRLTEAIDGVGGMEHSIPLTPLYRDVTEFLGRAGVILTPTFAVMRGEGAPSSQFQFLARYGRDLDADARIARFLPSEYLERRGRRLPFYFRDDEYAFADYARDAAAIVRAGGHVSAGGHGEFAGISNQWEMWALAEGMSRHEALRAGTLTPALATTLSADIGSLESGKLADLVILSANPLDDIRNTDTAVQVMKDGVLYDSATLAEQWPAQKPAPARWWAVR